MEDIAHKRKLVEYFKKNISKGYTEESLTWALVGQGYTRTDISSALTIAKKEISQEKKKVEEEKEKPKIKVEYYDVDNNPIKMKKPSSVRDFFKRMFS